MARLDRREDLGRPRQRVVDSKGHGPKARRGAPPRGSDDGAALQSNQYSGPVLLDSRLSCAQAPAATPSTMHLRALAAFALLSFALALAPLRPALAALAEELAEVTRLHHAGQSQAALERADRFLAGKPKDAQMRFLQGGRARRFRPARRGRDAARADLARTSPSSPSRTTTSRRSMPPRGDYGKARAELEESIRLNPGLRDRARESRRRLCHACRRGLRAGAAARARQHRPAEKARAGAPARRAAGGTGGGERRVRDRQA